jgi:hypothetical protein
MAPLVQEHYMDVNSEIDTLIGEVSGVELDRMRNAIDEIQRQPRLPGLSLVAFSTRSGLMICGADNEGLARNQAVASTAPISEDEARKVLPIFTANIIALMDLMGPEHRATQEAFEEATRVLMLALKAEPVPGRFYFCHAGINLKREPFAFVLAGRKVSAQ